jgi:hypothetical protein
VFCTQRKGIALSRSKTKKFVEPVTVTDEVPVERGRPRFRIESDALHSKTYTGKVSHGTYSLAEKNKGKIDRRLVALGFEGYRNVSVREVLSED